MSQSLLYHAFGVREGYEYRSTKYLEGRVEFHLSVKDESIQCPHCQGREYWRRGIRQRRINTLPIGPKAVVLVVEVPKCECRVCGKSFEHSPPFAPAYRHYSRALARFVCELSRFMSLQDVARWTHLGWDTVKSIVKADLARRFESVPLSGVSRIGVDENYLGKKAKYVTLVVDLDSGRVLWVGKGRGKEALEGFWERLRRSGTRIEAVACDMSGAYWSAINEHLPEAALVFDHFHIIKLANEKIDEIRRGLQRTLELDGQKFIKGTRYLLLYGKENLPPEKRPKLEQALAYNEPLSKAYYLKEELRQLWSQPGKDAAQKHLQDWILKAYATGIQPLKKLANTLLNHARQILSYFDHPISSGIMEGINNKIGRLTRLAYGYRDVDFLHLRIYALHESKDILTGT